MKWLLAASLLLAGCATGKKSFEIQCLDPIRIDRIEGPVIVSDDNVIFYDSKGKLVKVKSETCGVR